MKHAVPHDLGTEKAKEVAKAALSSYAKRFAEYNPTVNWKTETSANIGFSVKGVSLTGSLDVGPSSIDLDLDVPFLLRPFKGKAISVIEEEIKNWIGKSKSGNL